MPKRNGLRLSRETVRELSESDSLARVAGGQTVANECFSVLEGCPYLTLPPPHGMCISLAATNCCPVTNTCL
jgi:hypothetical protein